MRSGTATLVSGTTAGGLTPEEREWIICGMAWVSLRRWLCGAEEADRARAWFQEQMDLRFCARTAGRYITPDMERLEAELRGLASCGPLAPDLPARMPAAAPVA